MKSALETPLTYLRTRPWWNSVDPLTQDRAENYYLRHVHLDEGYTSEDAAIAAYHFAMGHMKAREFYYEDAHP